jgi:hypothetical protein
MMPFSAFEQAGAANGSTARDLDPVNPENPVPPMMEEWYISHAGSKIPERADHGYFDQPPFVYGFNLQLPTATFVQGASCSWR